MSFFAHSSAIIDANCSIGNGSKIWHFSHLISGCIIGENCVIAQNVMIAASVILGNNVKVQNNVSIYDGVICNDDVFIGPSVVFTNVINPRSAISRKTEYKKTIIKKGATIGANATIICGNTIGEYAFVAAGAVITKSVLPFALVMGCPAVQKGWVSEYAHALIFNEENIATCKETGQKYLLQNNQVIKIN